MRYFTVIMREDQIAAAKDALDSYSLLEVAGDDPDPESEEAIQGALNAIENADPIDNTEWRK